MIRNEKQESETLGYRVYSDKLNKLFDSVEELKAAEAEYEKKNQEKLEAANVKKQAAKVVEEAIKARVEAEQAAKKTKAAAYKAYLEICENAEKEVSEKKAVEKDALKEFCEKYGSFHSTIKIGDITYNCDYATESRVDPFKKLLDFWF